MQKILIAILLLCVGSGLFAKAINLNHQRGTEQSCVNSSLPQIASTIYDPNTTISISFDEAIENRHLPKNGIKLHFIGCDEEEIETRGKQCRPYEMKGEVSFTDDDAITFTPNSILEYGYYEVRLQGIKLERQKPLHPIMYRFKIEKNSVKNVTLTPENVEIKAGETTPLNVTATYKDGSSKSIDANLTWDIADESIAMIANNTILKALKEGETLVQASYEGISSQMIKISVYEEINGYRLPPQPDEATNNATQLGIDINNNGVRDDVERKIIITYQVPVKIELLLQDAKIHQEILANPIGNAFELQKRISAVSNCAMYLKRKKVLTSSENVGTVNFIENNTYNTKARVRAYADYNQVLSGGVYGSGPADWKAEACDFDVDTLLGAGK